MMNVDSEVRAQGIQVLLQHLGAVDAARFIAMINRERFDYTRWRWQQWQNETVASLATKARKIHEANGVSH